MADAAVGAGGDEGELLAGALEAVRRRRDDAAARRAEGVAEAQAAALRVDLGRKRVIQRRFNVSVPRARVTRKTSTLRDRSER